MERDSTTSRKILIQDLGILLFMLSVSGAGLITALAGKDLLYQNSALLLAVIMTSLLVVLRVRVAGTVAAAVTILAFTIYKIYNYFAYSIPIEPTAYAWPVLIVVALWGMTLFISLFSTIESVNSLLNQRLDELTVIDPLTGMENMRSMLSSLSRYMALSERNGTGMGLMMVRLRYADEISKVLTRTQFNDLRHILATTVQEVLRLEDRVFTIDDKGSLGIIYFSKESGASIVKGRILDAVANKNMLPDLNEQALTVELSVVYKQYYTELSKDAARYVNEVEKEFAFEV